MSWKIKTPDLGPISQCKTDLNFQPLAHWPKTLPAIAANGWVLAGFEQELVLNYQFADGDATSILEIFTSVHRELSFAELCKLWSLAESQTWFPFAQIAEHSKLRPTQQFREVAAKFLQLPPDFQKMCALKKWGLSDFLPLLAAGDIQLASLCQKILSLQLSKSVAAQALEYGVDLLLMGKSEADLRLNVEPDAADDWLLHLRHLRFPESIGQDQSAETRVQQIPWPGTSQVRWVRQGDRAGIEVKIFVTQPSDFTKHANSLERMQELLESQSSSLWKKQ